ncbi:MAG: DUF362 domain-containing protein [Desulfobacterales bacterium]|nr:DUF362 domain-containing protein [Desulfobacterales bacterium]
MPKVMIHPATYENVRPAVERAFELFPLDLKGKKVLIKPNLLRGSKAEEGVVTHPAVLRAVVEKVESMGPAQIVVGDNPGLFGYGANEQSFQQTGLMEAAKGYYRNIGNDARSLAFNPAFASRVSISQAILDADVVISLPKFKTHGLTVITGAIKNSYGMLPGAQKAKIHKEGNGPASPDLRDIGVIMAADNAVAMDAVMAHMMGCPPERLPFLQKAKALGLGDYDLAKIDIDGELKQIPNFKLPSLAGEAIAGNAAIQAFLHSKTVLRPKADPTLCTACGTCVAQCPAEALSIPEELPRVDADKCIVCFCCQEICPEKAITLQ